MTLIKEIKDKNMMRRTGSIAVAAALAVMVLTGPSIRASETDDQIEARAANMYVFDTVLKGDDVKIRSANGVVTLTGTVQDESRSLLAEEALLNLSGVKSVNNNLMIEGEATPVRSDAWINGRVKSVLLFHRGVSGLNTDISVKDGVVTLSGEADNSAQKQLASEYAKDVDGVVDVNNKMEVLKTPKKDGRDTIGENIDDASITSQVKMSLLFHRSTSALKTQVNTEDGVVTLSGMARNLSEKELVTKLVNDINGVTKVNNRMTIEKQKL